MSFDDGADPQLSVLIPALNEEPTIEAVVDRVLAVPLRLQVIVIDDGSTDRTGEILRSFGQRIDVITNVCPQGKGAALRRGLELARAAVVIVQDGDLEYGPEQIPGIVESILSGDSSVVYGNRFHDGFPHGMALPNRVVNRLLALTVRVLFGAELHDEATCYKAFRTDVLRSMQLQCTRFEFCPEVTAKAIRLGFRIREVPIQYKPRGKEVGKKIRWTDAPAAFWTLLRYRFWRPTQAHEGQAGSHLIAQSDEKLPSKP